MATRQPTYSDFVMWIALNDANDEQRVREVERSMTVLLVADLFGRSPRTVARAVINYRKGTPA